MFYYGGLVLRDPKENLVGGGGQAQEGGRRVEQGEGETGEWAARLQAIGGSFFGGEGLQIGPRKLCVYYYCLVRFHTYSLLYLVIPSLLLKLS